MSELAGLEGLHRPREALEAHHEMPWEKRQKGGLGGQLSWKRLSFFVFFVLWWFLRCFERFHVLSWFWTGFGNVWKVLDRGSFSGFQSKEVAFWIWEGHSEVATSGESKTIKQLLGILNYLPLRRVCWKDVPGTVVFHLRPKNLFCVVSSWTPLVNPLHLWLFLVVFNAIFLVLPTKATVHPMFPTTFSCEIRCPERPLHLWKWLQHLHREEERHQTTTSFRLSCWVIKLTTTRTQKV